MNADLLPNGSRLSCGRNRGWRKVVERQTKRQAGEATQFLPTCERPTASSAWEAAPPYASEERAQMKEQKHEGNEACYASYGVEAIPFVEQYSSLRGTNIEGGV